MALLVVESINTFNILDAKLIINISILACINLPPNLRCPTRTATPESMDLSSDPIDPDEIPSLFPTESKGAKSTAVSEVLLLVTHVQPGSLSNTYNNLLL